MSMVELVEMTPERFAAWSGRIWSVYRGELIDAGLSEEAADRNVRDSIEATMPGGVLAEGNFVLDVLRDGRPVGLVWLVFRDPDWHIYDLEIDEELRGQGLGRAALRCIEDHVRERGGTAVNLSVFGFNAPARHLYESEGYEVIRLQMKKSLEP